MGKEEGGNCAHTLIWTLGTVQNETTRRNYFWNETVASLNFILTLKQSTST
jgi:hypothetical protein